MNRIDHGLNMDSKVFTALKESFNSQLRSTLMRMEKFAATEAKITITLDIDLVDSHVPDHSRPQYPAERDITIPTFQHKVTSSIPVKDEVKGKTGGTGYELIWDRDTKSYYMISTKEADQISMFDEDQDMLPDEQMESSSEAAQCEGEGENEETEEDDDEN